MKARSGRIAVTAAGLGLALLGANALAQNVARPGTPPSSGPAPAVNSVFLPNAVITEGFDAVQVNPAGAADPPAVNGDCLLNSALTGWYAKNLASPLGTTCVFNGGAGTTFPSQAGATNSYAALNFNNSTGTGNINSWFVTPRVNFNPGARLEFYTRAAGSFPDRVQVRISTAADGGTPDVGTGNGPGSTVGTFTTLLLDINPTLIAGAGTCPAADITAAGATITGYPQGAWCRIVITGAALPTSGSGRIGFRYFTDNGGPAGANSNFIGFDTFSFDEGVANTPPTFAYAPAAGSTVSFTGGTTIGSTGTASIDVSVLAPGVGSGAAANTTTTCSSVGAPFAGFTQSVSAEGPGAISGSPLTGTCTLGAAAETQTLTCSENRGGTATPVTFTLSCPAGTAIPLTSNPPSGSTVTLPTQSNGGAATSSQITFQNPGSTAATVTCTAPTNTQFTVSPLSLPVAAGGSDSVTVSFSSAGLGNFTGVLNCTAGTQNFTFDLSGQTLGGVAIPVIGQSSRWFLGLLLLCVGLVAVGLRLR